MNVNHCEPGEGGRVATATTRTQQLWPEAISDPPLQLIDYAPGAPWSQVWSIVYATGAPDPFGVSCPLLEGDLNGSTQHFILNGEMEVLQWFEGFVDRLRRQSMSAWDELQFMSRRGIDTLSRWPEWAGAGTVSV